MTAATLDPVKEGSAAASPLRWRPGDRKFRLLAGILLALFAAYATGYLGTTLAGGSAHGFGDAFGVWSWARFLVTHPAGDIYDPALLRAGQIALGMDAQTSFPFAYPPSFLLVLWPLGQLPLPAAITAIILLTLPLYLWATNGRDWRSPALLAALMAPTTTIAVVAGQTAFLGAALLLGGFRVAEKRPLLGGALLGLLTYKPQLGLLVPVALVAARMWRTIAAAVATVLALVVVTSALFGLAIWPAWLAALPAYSAQFAAESGAILHLMPTVLATQLQIGVPPASARLVQSIAPIVMAGLVWAAFRSGPRDLAVAALFVAGFLATPYAFVYDMPIVATAVIWIIAERSRSNDILASSEILILLLAMLAPITLPPGTSRLPLGLVSLILLLGLILHRMRRLRRCASGTA